MNQTRQKAQICPWKNKGHIEYTAGQLESQDFVKQLIDHDDGYRAFKELRGSPPYWEQVKKELFALICSFGIPTWFTSFSLAETRWEHLLKILCRTVKGKELSDEEIKKLPWQQKFELVQTISCHVFQKFRPSGARTYPPTTSEQTQSCWKS